jgi:regulator of protease activity HflC (stomatin/prohibitin superfamily)
MNPNLGRGGIPAREMLTPGGGHVRTIAITAAVTVFVFLAILTFMSGAVVQAGYVGVVTNFGRVEDRVLPAGFHLIIPIAEQIHQVDVRVLPHTFKEIDAASKELQTVKLTGTMNYHLDQAKVNILYQTVGLDFADKVIDPAFNDFIKEVVPQYLVNDILANRDKIRSGAQQRLGENLARYGIVVDDIYISNIAFSKEFQDAIERKQTTQQSVETEQQILRQRQIQADQAVAQAEGEAKSAIARARGEAESNRARAESISPQLIDYLRWTKWDGRLPTVTGGGSNLLEIPIPPPGATSSQPSSSSAQPPAPTATPVSAPTPQASPAAGR